MKRKRRKINLLVSLISFILPFLVIICVVGSIVDGAVKIKKWAENVWNGAVDVVTLEWMYNVDDTMLKGTNTTKKILSAMADAEKDSYPSKPITLSLTQLVEKVSTTPKPTSNNKETSSTSSKGKSGVKVQAINDKKVEDTTVTYDEETFEYTYDITNSMYQFRLPWQFIYSVCAVANLDYTIDDLDNGNLSPDELEDYNNKDKKIKIKKSLVKKVVKIFNSEYDFVYDYYNAGLPSYSYATLQQLPHYSTNSGLTLTPLTALNSVKTYMYDYTFTNVSSSGDKSIKTVTVNRKFNKQRLAENLNDVGLSIKDIDLVILIMKELYGGEDLANELSAAYYGDSSEIDYDEFNFDEDTSTEIQADGEVGTKIDGLTYAPGGMALPVFYQGNGSPWANMAYGSSTIAYSGCCPTALSMIFTYLKGYTITPADIVSWCGNKYYIKGAGSSWSLIPAAANHWGLTTKQLGSYTAQDLVNALKDGKPVLLSMGPGTFTSSGHFIALRGYTEKNGTYYFYVNDPASKRKINGKTHSYCSFTADLVISESKQAWIISN